jgi:hypothetical protein
MERLTPEALARLVDHDPSPEENAALEAWPDAREELEALRQMTDALRNLPDVRPPRGDWEVLAARLASEGLIEPRSNRGRRIPISLPPWMQIAAALVLFLAGVGLGSGFRQFPGEVAGGAWLLDPAASYTQVAGEARSLEEAAEIVRLTEQPYYAALARYQQLATAARGGDPGQEDPAVRMAALEALLAASRAAIRQAPGDAFLNGILVSTTAEREAFLRRVASDDRANWF